MIQIAKFQSSFIGKLKLAGLRVIKILSAGSSAARSAALVQPFGEDSNPVSWKPIYADTENDSQPIVVGFINPNVVTELSPGEKRFFSTDANGNEQFYILLKNDKTIEIGGDADNMVRYSELEKGFSELQRSLNDLIQVFNLHTHVSSAPGSPSSPPATQALPDQSSISGAKINEIKTL